MVILFNSEYADPLAWKEAFRKLDSDIEFRIWPDVGSGADIECLLCWELPAGEFARLPNLKLICATSAGTDHLQNNPERPPHVPLTRMADPTQAQGMAAYVLGAALQYHLQLGVYREDQRQCTWRPRPIRAIRSRRVGLMGMGYLGATVAAALAQVGFDVAGWSRTGRTQVPGVRSFRGQEELKQFLGSTDILVCLLPLTGQTAGILGIQLFRELPVGAALICVGRGEHLVEADLLACLNDGHLSAATLDVFRQEPLPRGHPFWRHPKIFITPHIATTADPETAAIQVVENLRRLKDGEALLNVVDVQRGY